MKKVFELTNFTVFLSGLGSLVVRKSLIKPLTCFRGMKLKKTTRHNSVPVGYNHLCTKELCETLNDNCKLDCNSDKAPLNKFILKKTFLKS